VLALALVAVWTGVAAADLCLPAASTIEGIAGPPLWYGSSLARVDSLDDPRWVGASGRSFARVNGASSSGTAQPMFRGLSSGDDLYLSFRVFDTSGATPGSGGLSDAIYVGFAPQDNSAPARLLKIMLKTNADAVAQRWVSSDTDVLEFATYTRPADGTGAWANGPPNASTYVTEAALWIDAASDTWAVQLRVDTAALGFESFKVFYAIHVQLTTSPPPGQFLQYGSPAVVGAFSGASAAELSPIDPSVWANLVLDDSCADDARMTAQGLVTTHTPSDALLAMQDNTFAATPEFPSTGPMANLLPSSFRAIFRVVSGHTEDGSVTWTLLGEGTSASVTDGAGGVSEHTCSDAAGTGPCADFDVGEEHCVLVELQGTGDTAVAFSRDSAYRCFSVLDEPEMDAGAPDAGGGVGDAAISDAASSDAISGSNEDVSVNDGAQAVPTDDEPDAAGGTAGDGSEMPAPIVVVVEDRDGCGCSTLGARDRFDRRALGWFAIAIGMLGMRRAVRRRSSR